MNVRAGFASLFSTLTGEFPPPSERARLQQQLAEARAHHRATQHLLNQLRILTNDELRAAVDRQAA